jgi:peptidoglycan/xylan/chitin deacetylase (PgdA/CDA1 family)
MEENLYKKKIAVLTIDVEEWYHLEYFKLLDTNKNLSTLDGLDIFVDIINRHNIKASFFIVGELMNKLKNKIKILKSQGHDIGIHSYNHQRPVEQTIKEFSNDVIKCKNTLNDIFPNSVFGYRAPCFALDRERLNVLSKMNFKYDASKIVQKDHPLYVDLDVSDFDQIIQNGLYEKENFKVFEVSTINFFSKQVPISGGGYLRLIPWPIYFWLLKRYIKKNNFFNFFIHPFELSQNNFKLPKKTNFITSYRYKKNRKKTAGRLIKVINLLKDNNFTFKTFSEI